MKKVLVVSYYFPPMGMGGVQRTAKFVKYLPSYGWKPIVLTVTPSYYLAKDDCLLHELEQIPEIEIRRTESSGKNMMKDDTVVQFKNDKVRKVLSNASQFFLVPDNKIRWKQKAIELAEKIISEHKIDLIYSTAPPYTDFLIAKELKEKYNIPVVLDYRDSWYDCPNIFFPTVFHKRQHKKLETEVLKTADEIITINRRIKELIIERFPFVKDGKVKEIPQGFDESDFGISTPLDATVTIRKMRFTYSGSFLNYYTPKYFLQALANVIKSNPELKDKIEACFVGTMTDEHKEMINELGLKDNVLMTGYVAHSEAIKYLISSDVLWMMINKTERSDLHSTGKLYEYFGARKPILACIPDGVAKESLKEHGAVVVTEPDDVSEIENAILSYYQKYKNGSMPKVNEKFVMKYERKGLTEKLVEVFESVLSV